MWILGNKDTWVNLNTALRVGKDGTGQYIVVCSDGIKVTIDKDAYDKAMKWIDPDWYEKHPKGNSIDFDAALKAIMKATGAKLEKGEKDDKKED